MKTNKHINNYYDYKRNSTKAFHVGDVWLVKFPYSEQGNWYKIRPALIIDIRDEEVIVQKITSQPHEYEEIKFTNQDRKSYLSNNIVKVKDYELIRKIGKRKW